MTEGVTTLLGNAPSEGEPDEVTVDGETVTMRLCSQNPALRAALEGHEPVARTHLVLDVGARALQGAGASVEADAIGAQVEQLKQQLQHTVDDVHQRLTAHTESLFGDEDGSVTTRITSTVEEVERLLGETFDDDSKSSAIAKIEAAMKATAEELQTATRRQLQGAFDPEGDGQWARSLKGLLERLDTLEKSIGEVSEKVAASQAAATMHDRTAVKGFDYEDVVDRVASEIATAQGDVLERVTTTKGSLDRKAGDFVATINSEGSPTVSGRYVLEVQDQQLTLGKAQEKAELARRNRDATAAVMVFAAQEHAPTSSPFVPLGPFGETAIVVLDKHEPDPLALKVAMGWARAAVRLHRSDDDTELDHKRIQQALDRLRRSLEKVSTIKGNLTTATKAIDDGRGHLQTFADEVDATLTELDELINRPAA